ncbi:MAG: hypothetical protein IK093_15355 [Ruminiclostridium sp.]|nr:hypothetical protein [Ruminiclostridium sp.]
MSSKIGKEKWVIIKNILVTLLVIAFFVAILIVSYNMNYNEKHDNIILRGEMAAKNAADRIDKYLSTNIDSIKLSAYALDEMIQGNKSDEEIQDFLVSQSTAIRSAVLENSTGLYGYINGRFFSGTNWEPPEDYNATLRPWYTKPMSDKGQITILDPYVDVQSGNVMLAVGKTLSDGKSVISVDISLDRVQQITEESVATGSSDAEMILNDKGIVVAHSDTGEIGKDYSAEKGTLQAAIMENLTRSDSNNFEFNYQDSHYVVYAASLMDDWYCISITDATAVFSPLRLILLFTVITVIVVVLVISIIMTASSRRQIVMERLGKQLSATADIYISVYELDLLNDTFNAISGNSDIYISESSTAAHGARQNILSIYEKNTDPSSKESMLEFVDLSTLNERMRNVNTITTEFLSAKGKWRRARFIVSERIATGDVARALYLVEDIDEERRDSDKMQNTAKLLTSQLDCLANIYTSVHDYDIPNDSFSIIKMNDTFVQNAIGNDVNNARKVFQDTMTKLTDESCRKEVLEFVKPEQIEVNVAKTGTATIEFLNSRGQWCRGRFIVSERTGDGGISHVIWAVENIDSEKRERDRLTEDARSLSSQIASLANVYIAMFDVDLKADTFSLIKSDNETVTRLVGDKSEDAQKLINYIMDRVTDPSSLEEVHKFINFDTLGTRLENTDTVTLELLTVTKKWVRIRFMVSQRTENGKLSHVMWLAEDIDNERSERNELIDASERAIAASEEQSAFLSNMSDRLRTPITTVLDTNEIILGRSGDEEITRCANIIKSTETDLLCLVTDILDFSKIETGKMEIIPADYELSAVINSLVDMIKPRVEAKGLKLVLDINRQIPRFLNGDEARIRQIIGNLLMNAVRYTEEGKVTFCVRYEKIPDEPDSVMLKVNVRDTGTGIQKENMKTLFSGLAGDDNQSSSAAGSVLSLSITKQLLEMMDSTLVAESIYGLGSKFSFELKQTVVKWDELGEYRYEISI